MGDFKNNGRELRPAGNPEPVRVHDFDHSGAGQSESLWRLRSRPQHRLGQRGSGPRHGGVCRGDIRRWWHGMGQDFYPQATDLLITADSGGSNGARVRLWKLGTAETGRRNRTEHQGLPLPPGTSKWNKIEHRLFSFISQNWRGKPLISHEVIVNLIAATTTDRRTPGPFRDRRKNLSCRSEGVRQGTLGNQHPQRQVPRRLELQHQTPTPLDRQCYFVTSEGLDRTRPTRCREWSFSDVGSVEGATAIDTGGPRVTSHLSD